jgi:hypothetical protein
MVYNAQDLYDNSALRATVGLTQALTGDHRIDWIASPADQRALRKSDAVTDLK